MGFNLASDRFWSEPALDQELRRVFDICNGCRRCYALCPSFNTLFQRLDDERVDGEAEKLGEGDLQVVGEECYQLILPRKSGHQVKFHLGAFRTALGSCTLMPNASSSDYKTSSRTQRCSVVPPAYSGTARHGPTPS